MKLLIVNHLKLFTMKSIKTLLILLSLCFATQADAQIWKKLGKKVERAAEKTLEKKVEEKTERETEKAFDSTFNNSKKNKKANPFNVSGSKAEPASSYTFSHKYVMKIESGKRAVNINYYLSDSQDYFGTSMPEQDQMISVMDFKRKSLFMFMNTNGSKMLMSTKLDFEDLTDDAIEETDVSVTATGKTKTILGYTCEEFKVVGKDMTGTVWIAPNAGVSFAKSFYNVKAKKGASQSWMKMLNGLTMEMDMVDTSKRKPQRIKMTCIALDKTTTTIQTNDYKKML
ncbi:DUF4412 domain-containing protein [Olleya sp. YS]|uniref:DUF4412 domain-containing protein n=1 Tax=Olleya sp. YS TaxID=3028318 RepID=UPI002434365B|nr:DUF4412 domain-containing protein [Olleya sp. YS]WGD35254.1 DUF4412 domain-containing protein [Olleya sp. YS]